MTSDDLEPQRVHSTGRTGITYGILFAVLIALLFFFYWRGTGARGHGGERPAPAGATR